MHLAHSFLPDQRQRSSQQPLVLVVEDHNDSLLLMSYTLELFGCRFLCQTDSSATVVVAKEHQPDLIMLDILLHSSSGLDIVRELKQEPLTSQIPVLAVTALASREDQELIFQAGFDEYVCKPYMLEELETIVRRLLDGKFEAVEPLSTLIAPFPFKEGWCSSG